jgi:hypothetical protein
MEEKQAGSSLLERAQRKPWFTRIPSILWCLGALFVSFAKVTAGPVPGESSSQTQEDTSLCGVVEDYFLHWFDRVDHSRATQPKWMVPVVTIPPTMQELFRFDTFFQRLPNGTQLTNLGGGRTLQLVPWETVEVDVGYPPYLTRSPSTIKAPDGWGDTTFAVKYRLLSATENEGNYVVSPCVFFTAPTADHLANSAAFNHAVYTPGVLFGKGWGEVFDIQANVLASIPDGGPASKLFVYNVVFQGHFAKVIWPEVELNGTYWIDGAREGKNQLFLTPGIVLARFTLFDRLQFGIGAGYQIALTPNPVSNHNWILTVRLPF